MKLRERGNEMEDVREVTSLVDRDIVIIKAFKDMEDKEIKRHEKELSKKLNKKVVVLPNYLELCDYKDTLTQMQMLPCELKEQTVDTWEELKDALRNGVPTPYEWDRTIKATAQKIKQEEQEKVEPWKKLFKEAMENILSDYRKEDNTLEYKILNKKDFEKIMIDKYTEHIDSEWKYLSRGDKYIVCTKDEEGYCWFSGLNVFYNKNILSCNK